jgi:hypothetical protein
VNIRKLIVFAGTLGLVGIIGVPLIAGASPVARHRATLLGHRQKKQPKHHKTRPLAALTPHIGQVAFDGDVAFRVTNVECGVTHLGTARLGAGTLFGDTAPAGSQWCLVSMTMNDDKSIAQTFYASNQYAIDGNGAKLSATTRVLVYIPNDSAAERSKVEPGVSISVIVPFELSNTDSIKEFQLHDSAISKGVTVYNVT